MKRIIFTVVLLTLVLASICSCRQTDTNNISIEHILEVDEGYLQAKDGELNRANLIYNNTVRSVDENADAQKEVTMLGKNYTLTYTETIFYPIGNKYADIYKEAGTDVKVLYDKDGDFFSVSFDFAKIDFAEGETPENILKAVKQELKDLVDLSYYEYADIPEKKEKDDSGKYYYYLLYNMVDGCMTDFCKFSVTVDGYVCYLTIWNINLSENYLNLQINKELAEKLLSEKVKSVYNTSETKLVSYETKHLPQIVEYEDTLYVKYTVAAKYTDSPKNEISDWLTTFLIPLWQITLEP